MFTSFVVIIFLGLDFHYYDERSRALQDICRTGEVNRLGLPVFEEEKRDASLPTLQSTRVRIGLFQHT